MNHVQKSLANIVKTLKIICYILLFIVPTILVVSFIGSMFAILLPIESIVYVLLIISIVLMVLTFPLGIAYFVLSIILLVHANNNLLNKKNKKNSIIVGILGIIYFNLGFVNIALFLIQNTRISHYILIIIYCIQVCLLIASIVKINVIRSNQINKKTFSDSNSTNITAAF